MWQTAIRFIKHAEAHNPRLIVLIAPDVSSEAPSNKYERVLCDTSVCRNNIFYIPGSGKDQAHQMGTHTTPVFSIWKRREPFHHAGGVDRWRVGGGVANPPPRPMAVEPVLPPPRRGSWGFSSEGYYREGGANGHCAGSGAGNARGGGGSREDRAGYGYGSSGF